jgi:hypothetical protein
MKRALLVVAAVVSLAGAAPARAQAPAPANYPQVPAGYAAPPGYHQHDGFFLQLDAGFGGMGSTASDLKLSGSAGQFSVAVGGAVAENFILAGQAWGIAVNSPDVSVSGQRIGSADATLGLSGIGLNLTYYFMPINLYVSATPSIGALSLKQGGVTYQTDDGFALRLAVGKEWWVSTDWGLGLNVQYVHGSNPVQGASAWTTNWFGAAFSATYN